MAIAIYVDYENLRKQCEINNIQIETVIGEITQKALAKGQIHECRLFVPSYFTSTAWRILNSFQHKFGVEISACAVLSQKANSDVRLKDCVDLEVFRWVLNHVHHNIGPNMVIFVTGDGHFLFSGNETKRRGKEIEFWSLNAQSVHGLIKRQEIFREIKIEDQIVLAEENRFLTAMNNTLAGNNSIVGDAERVNMMVRFIKANVEYPAMESTLKEASDMIGSLLGILVDEAQELLEAMMALGIARIYPSVRTVIDINKASNLFQWLQSQSSTLT